MVWSKIVTIASRIWDYFFPKNAKRTNPPVNTEADTRRINHIVDRMVKITNLYDMSSGHDNLLAAYLNQAPKDLALMQACSSRLKNLEAFPILFRNKPTHKTEYDLFVSAIQSLNSTKGYSVQRYLEQCPLKRQLLIELEKQIAPLERVNARFKTYIKRLTESALSRRRPMRPVV